MDADLPISRRQGDRRRTLKTAKLVFGGISQALIDCYVVDMSDTGARIETAVMVQVPETLFLRLSDGSLHRVRKCWAKGNEIGLEFIGT